MSALSPFSHKGLYQGWTTRTTTTHTHTHFSFFQSSQNFSHPLPKAPYYYFKFVAWRCLHFIFRLLVPAPKITPEKGEKCKFRSARGKINRPGCHFDAGRDEAGVEWRMGQGSFGGMFDLGPNTQVSTLRPPPSMGAEIREGILLIILKCPDMLSACNSTPLDFFLRFQLWLGWMV